MRPEELKHQTKMRTDYDFTRVPDRARYIGDILTGKVEVPEQLKGTTFAMDQWCGTACCIAGHIALLLGKPTSNVEVVHEVAQEWLQLSNAEAEELFIPQNFWEKTERDAAAMLYHFADTCEAEGGVIDWSVAMEEGR